MGFGVAEEYVNIQIFKHWGKFNLEVSNEVPSVYMLKLLYHLFNVESTFAIEIFLYKLKLLEHSFSIHVIVKTRDDI